MVSYKETMPALGQSIRQARQRAGRSLADLARKSGFSKGFLSKIENGKSQPPIATLMRLAEALDVPLSAFFDGAPPASTPGGVLTRAKDRQVHAHDRERGYAFERLAVASPYALTPYIFHLAGEQAAPPGLRHPGEEVVHVLRGELDYLVGTTVHRLRRGDTLVFDAAQLHGAIKLPNKTATFLAVFAGRP